MAKKAPTLETLVTTGCELKRRIRQDTEALKGIEAQILDKKIAGKLLGVDGAECTAVFPGASFSPSAEDIPAVRKLCGTLFAKLFTRKESYSPAKNARDIATAMLPAPKLKKLLTLVSKPASAWIAWPK